MTQMNTVEPFVAVNSHFYSDSPSMLSEFDKKRLYNYDRETMLHLRQFSYHLPKLPLPVLPCTIPEEFSKGIEENRTTFRTTIPAGTNPRVSTNGRRNLKESGNIASPILSSPQIQSPLIPDGIVSAKMMNRAAALISSRSDLTNSKGEIIQPHLETPPAISSPLLGQNEIPARLLGQQEQQPPHINTLMDKLSVGEKKMGGNRGEIDRSEMPPMYETNRSRLKSSQESIPLRSSLDSIPEDSSLYQRLRSLPTASPVSNSPAFAPRRTVLSSSSAYNHSSNNSPMLSPSTGSPLTNRYIPLPTSLLSSSSSFSSADNSSINLSAEIPAARNGYVIPVGRDADVFSPKMYANVRRSNSALTPSIHSPHSFNSSNGHEIQHSNSPNLFSSAPLHSIEQRNIAPPGLNGTESTSFINSLLPASNSHDPRQGHMPYPNLGQNNHAQNATYYNNLGVDKWFGSQHPPPAMMHNPNLP